MKGIIKALHTSAVVALIALTSSQAVAQTAPAEPAKIVKLKSRCAVDTRLLQMAVGNKAREAMAAAGYSKVVVTVTVKPEQTKLVDVTAANVLGLSDVKITGAAEPKFTIVGGTTAQPLETSCLSEVTFLISAAGAKADGKRLSAQTESKHVVKGVFR